MLPKIFIYLFITAGDDKFAQIIFPAKIRKQL